MPDWTSIAEQLKTAGIAVSEGQLPQPVSGGDISDAWRVITRSGAIFLKSGPLQARDQFAAEAEGLLEIAATNSVRVPAVLATGENDGGAFLALEWIQFEPANAEVEAQLGERLALMHACTQQNFGWHRANTIGLTPQHNPRTDNWVEFFREHRLGFQLQLARHNGFTGELQVRGAQLLKRLPGFFDEGGTEAALLHGDLWGGNWAGANGEAVVFDPAVYYGDREADIAMTHLFGGFGPAFYSAYEARWPKRDGYAERQCLYQLYHVLNHLNLFGSGYLVRALQLMDTVL